MIFSFAGDYEQERYQWFADGLRDVMRKKGHEWVENPDDAELVINFFPSEKPRPFRRRAQAVFLTSVTEMEGPLEQPIHDCYPILVRSLANLVITLVRNGKEEADHDPEAHFLTPEQGHYVVEGNHDREAYFEKVYSRIEPLATSRLVIDNIFHEDLPEELWDGDEITESIYRAGKKLGNLDLLPTPFPLHQILPERDQRHLKKLYGLGGLSYGNVSARKDEERFWMSASGVDKTHLKEIGTEVLLVKDYDPERNAMILSVPPGVEPRRVSVDAIEHWMIYREHPDVGAIVHVHGWIEGIEATDFNYPCGTYELGKAVADIVREAPDPSRAVVGLKNHGITITGRSLDELFERVGPKIDRVVPME